VSVAADLHRVRSALYLPASNARAIEKARTLSADLVILDLEDAVKDEDKASARVAALAAGAGDWRAPLLAVRINGSDSRWHADDLAALKSATRLDLIVVPKVEDAVTAAGIAKASGKPLLAMIETPAGIYAAREIAAAEGVAGLIAGTNDIATDLRLPPSGDRTGLGLALQMIVLAARAAGGIALDGVYNRLDDPDGLAAQCAEGRLLGFDGKTVIHPSQIEPANRAFGPSESELEDARALIDAQSGGAERFRGRMIESMHVREAKRLIERAGE
jgi:citrate lyase subunit beta/citryl-CoA lyase